MKDVFARLGADFFSTIVFLAIYLATDNVLLATGVAIAGAIAPGDLLARQGQAARLHDLCQPGARDRARQRDAVDPRSALRAGKARDRAFRDRRHHAQARLDAALHAADRDRDHSRIRHLRGLRLGRADVRARRRHHRRRDDRRHEAVDVLRDRRRWSAPRLPPSPCNMSRFVFWSAAGFAPPPAPEYAAKMPDRDDWACAAR